MIQRGNQWARHKTRHADGTLLPATQRLARSWPGSRASHTTSRSAHRTTCRRSRSQRSCTCLLLDRDLFYSVIYQLYWQITSDGLNSTVDFAELCSSVAAAGTVRTLQSGACCRTTLLLTLAPTRLWRHDMPQHAQQTTRTCQLSSHCNCRQAGPTPAPIKPKPTASRRE